jgi:LmbE family N-acetylglucosaminyl deacetylase
MAKKETVLVIVAHNDDHIIGAGGTLAKYAKEGKKVKTIIMSYGESSHPHLQPKYIIERRYKESLESDKIIGGSGLVYLGLKEGKFRQEFKKKKLRDKLAFLIRREKPGKIFTLGPGDMHPDHNAVWRIVEDLMKSKDIKCPVYAFEVWSAVQTFKRNAPKLIVDVSDTYQLKSNALKAHKSQAKHLFPFIPALNFKMWVHAIMQGWAHGCRYAEVFYKLN